DLVVSDDARRGVELAHPHPVEIGPYLRRVHRGVQDVAGLATGAADENAAGAGLVVAVDSGRALRRLVVGVGVHGQQPELVVGQIGHSHGRANLPGPRVYSVGRCPPRRYQRPVHTPAAVPSAMPNGIATPTRPV